VSVVRERKAWEPYIVSGCITLVTLVLTVCAIILIIYSAMFAVATMKAHWP
jgi:hypothetical protein